MGEKDITQYLQIGQRIRRARMDTGKTQREIAGNIGVPFSTYSNYENGNRTPKMDMLMKIANALDISIVDLLGYHSPNISRDDVVYVISQYQAILHFILQDDAVPDEVKEIIREELPDPPTLPLAVLSAQAELVTDDPQNKTPDTPKEASDDDIKFALFGGDGDITDEMYDDVKRYAEFIAKKKKQQQEGK